MTWSEELWNRAKQATPGQWLCWRDGVSAEVWADEKDINIVCRCVGENQKGEPTAEANANALFISSVNPETVMRMLEVVEQAKSCIESFDGMGHVPFEQIHFLKASLLKFEGDFES